MFYVIREMFEFITIRVLLVPQHNLEGRIGKIHFSSIRVIFHLTKHEKLIDHPVTIYISDIFKTNKTRRV